MDSVRKGEIRLAMNDGHVIVENGEHRYHAHYKNLVIDVTDGVRELMRQAAAAAVVDALREAKKIRAEQEEQLARYRQILAITAVDHSGPTA